MNELREAAEKGNAEAQFNLGLCYENGEGIQKDLQAAVNWYRQAAEKGNAEAQYYLCLLYTSPSPRDATLSRMPSSA